MKKPLAIVALLIGIGMATSSSVAVAASKTPGITFNNGKLHINPAVSIGIFHDSNVHGTYDTDEEGEEGGAGWKVAPTLQLNFTGKSTSILLGGSYTANRGFNKEDSLDTDSYGQNLVISHQLSRRIALTLTQSFSHSENDEFRDGLGGAAPSIDNRATQNLSINGALAIQLSSLSSLSLGAGYTLSNSLEDDGADSTSYSFQGQYSRQRSAHTNWLLTGSLGLDKPDDGQGSNSYTLLAGIGSNLAKNINYQVQGGFSVYAFEGSQSETNISPSYSVTLAWQVAHRLALSMAMNSNYQPSDSQKDQANSYIWVNSMTMGVNYKPAFSDKVTFRLDVGYNLEQTIYSGESTFGYTPDDYDRNYFNSRFNVYYAFNPYLSLYAGTGYNYETTNEGGDDKNKTEIRSDIGLQFKY